MVTVHQEVPAYLVGGTSEGKPSPQPLVVRSHWNDDKMIVLRLGGGEEISVRARDLDAAVKNATNTARF